MAVGRRAVAIVTGASSQVGRFLVPRLQSAGHQVFAVGRQDPSGGGAGVRWIRGDLAGPLDWSAMEGASTLIHIARLDLLPDHLTRLAAIGVLRIVAFSSTSRIVKAESPEGDERRIAASLAQAEERVLERCRTLGIHCTLFLPTLIYGSGQDRNVSFIAGFVRRFRFFPLAAGGAGRRQPVHADDLAAACIDVLENHRTYGKRYLMPGGETLSYREMVERVFRGLGMKPRFLPVPLGLLSAAVGFGRLLPGYRHLNREMVERVGKDLCFDASDARRDFGYAPRPFVFQAPRRRG